MLFKKIQYCLLSVALAVLAFIFSINNSFGQSAVDTLRLSLGDAEQIFLKKNLSILAQQYNVDAAKCLILQAKLWSNPNINIAKGAYDPGNKKWFESGSKPDANGNYDGETALQIQQLIFLAGKINKQVKMAKTNADIAEYTLFDLLRTLKYTLRSDFNNIYFLQQTAKVYQEEINSLQKIAAAFAAQKEKGYLARTEVVRIEAQLYSLQSEFNDLNNQINDKESEMRLLLQAAPGVYLLPHADTLNIVKIDPLHYTLQTLLDSAYKNRYDLAVAKANVTLSEQNYSYQRALTVPDVTIGAAFDQNGSYLHDATLLSLGFDLPVFNRNQGNIRSAKAVIKVNEAQFALTQKTVEEQVFRSIQLAVDYNKLYKAVDKSFAGEFSKLAQAMLENYTKRNVNMLDFLNFYDSYKQTVVQYNYIMANMANAYEGVNFTTGTSLFNK